MASERVLVVGAVSGLSRELSTQGYVVQHATSTRPLWSSLGTSAWDACVLSAEQLETEGHELVRHARERDPGLSILVSGTDGERVRNLALLSGADNAVVPGDATRPAWAVVRHAIGWRREVTGGRNAARANQILMLDWDELEAHAVRDALSKSGFAVSRAADARAALGQLRELLVDVLITPASAHVGGESLVEAALRYDPRLRIIVTSDISDLEGTATAMGQGAHGHLLRPVGAEQAIGTVQSACAVHADLDPGGEPTAQQLSVLLIEHEPLQARLAEEMLHQEGRFAVTTVVDLARGRLEITKHSFDAIVSALDGERSEALRALKELRCLDRDAALVLIATRSDPSFQDQAMRMGVEDLISRRRLGREALGARVRAAVQRNQARLAHERFVRDLQTREASHQLMVRRSADGLLIVDGRGVVLFSNPAAEQMFQDPRGPLLGRAFPYTLGDAGPREIQIRECAPPCVAELTRANIEWNGASAHLVSLRDVTERRQGQQLRDRLAHTERLAAIGQLAAGVSHEINNPAAYVVANLTTMRDMLAALENEAPRGTGVGERLRELGEMARENLDGMSRIRSITSDLRTFARIDSNELTLVDLNDCATSACRIAFNEIRHRAHLVQEFRELPKIRASHGKLAQVVTNLLVNAAQAIPEGNVEHHRVTVRTGATTDEVWLHVEDTGCGLTPELQAQMFDPFFTTKARGQGTGLGLALCADIIRQHKGSISPGRGPEGGTCFEVRLPRNAELEQVSTIPVAGTRGIAQCSSEIAPRVLPIERLRLLLIDDEPLVLRSLRRMLSEHEVDAVQSGSAALSHLLVDRGYDLIFCDLMMPEMDGTVVYGEIERVMPELCERIIFCSGGAFTRRTKHFLEHSRRPLIEKPLTRESFEQVARLAQAQRPILRNVMTSG